MTTKFSYLTITTLSAYFLQARIINAWEKPNVMIIFADDVGTGDVPGYWNTGLVNMPNLQNLVANGTTFLDAHSTPKCAPSRYVMLSGNYPHRGLHFGGTWRMNYKGSQFRRGQKSIAKIFQDNGYNTAMFGKWHLGGKIPTKKHETLIDDWSNTVYFPLSNPKHKWKKQLIQGPSDIGFDTSYVTISGIQNGPYAFLRNSTFDTDVFNNIKFWNKGTYTMPCGMSKINEEAEGSIDWDSSAYNMILVNETRQFLDDHINNKKDQPFFTYVSLGSVHTPHSPPNKYVDGINIAGQYETGHMDLLGEMDHVVGSLINMLEDRKLIKNTIILFTSDNGGLGSDHGSVDFGHNSSGPLRAHKGSIYEGGHRIPMIFRWDKHIPKSETRDRVVGLNDVYATLCQLARINIPRSQAIDSISFAKYAIDRKNYHDVRKSLGTWAYENGKLIGSSLRMWNMKLIYHHDTRKIELFDLDEDLSETTDVKSKHPFIVQNYLKLLKEISPCYDSVDRFKVFVAHKQKWKRKTCDWFKRNKSGLCRRYPEGRLYCGQTCAMEQEGECRIIRKSFMS